MRLPGNVRKLGIAIGLIASLSACATGSADYELASGADYYAGNGAGQSPGGAYRGPQADYPQVLGDMVREERRMSLPEAIRKMTSYPAQRLGLSDRGLLVPGMTADVVVFDLDEVRDVGTFSDPHHYAEGMVHVFVNGRAAIRDGEFTGERAGEVLHKERPVS